MTDFYSTIDCETSYRWFLKKSDSFEGQTNYPANKIVSKDTQHQHKHDIHTVTRCTSERILPSNTHRLAELRARDVSTSSHSNDLDDDETVIPFDDIESISSRTSSPMPTQKEYKKPAMIYADDASKPSNQYFTGVRAMIRSILL
jgi:hypothetical protein